MWRIRGPLAGLRHDGIVAPFVIDGAGLVDKHQPSGVKHACGSDRAADRWLEDYAIAGVEGLDLHHLYRAMAWLDKELPEKEQGGRTPRGWWCP